MTLICQNPNTRDAQGYNAFIHSLNQRHYSLLDPSDVSDKLSGGQEKIQRLLASHPDFNPADVSLTCTISH